MTGAIIDGPYRYRLWREWSDGPRVLFVMLNPSTASFVSDDPTIRRCIGYAKALDVGAIDVVNLFALRATNPEEIAKHADPVGPENDHYIAEAACAAEMVICAWGAHPQAKNRASRVLDILRRVGQQPMCLRQTKAGHPAHPLYLPATLRPVPFAGARGMV
jgi:hypothetical protein